MYDPGAFKLVHLQSMKAIFEKRISAIFPSHMQHFDFSIISIMALMIEGNIEAARPSMKSMIDMIVPTLVAGQGNMLQVGTL